LAAHLDGLSIAGDLGQQLCAQAFERGGAGEMFTAAVRVLEDKNTSRLNELCALAFADPEMLRGLLSALGWVSPRFLRGTIKELLAASDIERRRIGIAACAMHRVDPGIASGRLIEAQDENLRARALRASGELGLTKLVSACAAAVHDDDPECQFWAAWSAVLLGDREIALYALLAFSEVPGPHQAQSFQLTLQAMSSTEAHGVLQALAKDPLRARWLIRGSGLSGNPAYVPWLIGKMRSDPEARLAGEAFSWITGVDIRREHLKRDRPPEFESGPNDDPDDANVQMEEDDGLPWPGPSQVEAWWSENAERFQPGVRTFLGEPVSSGHCLQVLRAGYQRQRIGAALFLALLHSDQSLFEWRAPAWRQQRLLAQMN
jgi:uncharacterized protein (TIGR02270 family)